MEMGVDRHSYNRSSRNTWHGEKIAVQLYVTRDCSVIKRRNDNYFVILSDGVSQQDALAISNVRKIITFVVNRLGVMTLLNRTYRLEL